MCILSFSLHKYSEFSFYCYSYFIDVNKSDPNTLVNLHKVKHVVRD